MMWLPLEGDGQAYYYEGVRVSWREARTLLAALEIERVGYIGPAFDRTLAKAALIRAAIRLFQDWEYAQRVAICGTCELRANDPAVALCNRTDCGLVEKVAA